MKLEEIQIFFHPKDRLRMTVGDRSYPTVRAAWAAPLTRPDQYLALLDGKGNEIVTIPEPKELPAESMQAVQEELRKRYLTARIVKIEQAKVEFGATYWHVITDRGERDFVTQSLQENTQWLGTGHLLFIDVDGNRFEVPDVAELDVRSQALIDSVL